MSDNQTIYIGNGVKKKDNWLTSSLCLSDIPKEHVFEYNGKKYIKVNINVRDEQNEYGKDVSISVDTWKPEAREETPAAASAPSSAPPLPEDDELPF